MAQITMDMIKELRERTSAGVVDCKKVLAETNGDIEKAIEELQKRGIAKAAKKQGRIAAEGKVGMCVANGGRVVALVEMNCETDFVAKNGEFIALTQQILDAAIEHKPETLEDLLNTQLPNGTVHQLIMDKIGATGEKMELGYFEHISAPSVVSYIHMGNKLATIVGFNKENVDGNVAKDVAMQVAAMNPISITPDTIPADVKEKELEIAREKAREAGKPENLLDRIAEGALQKFYKESTLLQQEYVKDNKMNIEQFLKQNDKDLTVTVFKRVSLNV